jgi:molybdopterin-containing oxidoreductase family iron-sulfur binding subunit
MSSNNDSNEPTKAKRPLLDLDAINAKLKGKKGPAYWRSLEEVAETPEFQAWIDDEFPNRRDLAGMDRRTLLKYMGASLALAGVSGCRGVFLPEEKLVPYVKQPEEMTIGKPLYYATAMPYRGYGIGVLVEQREGRPIKLEGNLQHPISQGSLDAQTQAQILNFYDPDRISNVFNQGSISTWEQFSQVVNQALAAQKAKKGAGLRILTETVTSPSLVASINTMLAAYPMAKWSVYEAVNRDTERAATMQAFGKPYDVTYDLTKANVIVTLDADFIQGHPDSVQLARQFAEGRRDAAKTLQMNRMYAIESSMTITGATADHRWPVKPSEVQGVAVALASSLGIPVSGGTSAIPTATVAAIASDLQANAGKCLVMPGRDVSPSVAALAYAVNQKLGNVGQTINFIEPVEGNPVNRVESLALLTDELNKGLVDTVIIIGGNPVFTAPSDINFGAALAKAKFSANLSEYADETGDVCQWTLPMAHPLEAWGDYRAIDGTVSIAQPLMAPLHGGDSSAPISADTLSPIEAFSVLMDSRKAGYDILRSFYTVGPIKLDEKAFRRALYAGIVPNTASKPAAVGQANVGTVTAPAPGSGVEIKFVACPKIQDGRFANNGWLRELPHNVTKVTWDNVIEISPNMAKDRNIESGNVLELDGLISGPAWIQPGQPDGSITVTLGYGHETGGAVASTDEGRGYNAYKIRKAGGMSFAPSVDFTNSGGDFRLANVQMHHAMDGRDIVRVATLAKVVEATKTKANPYKFDEEEEHTWKEDTMYPDEIFQWDGEQWGMTIDLNLCTGCNACVTACQAENNIPVVGKDQVARGREMHWIRVDRYYGPNEAREENESASDLENPTVVYQPVMCLHCEKAPCEPVCPVAATVHSHDGLNQMVYNRCVGTRYCSDNCPYKVRRFNFLNYTDNQIQFAEESKIPLLRLLNNPDVTVRGRGVMEKCSYCVQRISDARIEAKKAGLPIADGNILTACQQACPSKAIIFGNIADRKSKVFQQWDTETNLRSYLLLEDLNTRPRTRHLSRLRNPNPEIKA